MKRSADHGPSNLQGSPPIAVARDGRIWMAKGFERYDIGLWEGNRRDLLLRREAAWFPELTHNDLTHGWDQKPAPFIYYLALDKSETLLWVSGAVVDEEWWEVNADEASGGNTDEYYDDMLEVIDLRTNSVIASQRFDRSYHLIEAGLIGTIGVTPTGSVRYQTFKVLLDSQKSQEREGSWSSQTEAMPVLAPIR